MQETQLHAVETLCRQFRIQLIRMLFAAQTGHPGGSLSCCEILTLLYQSKLNIDPNNPHAPWRDRLVLSKGHAAPMLYLNLAGKGFFADTELSSFRQLDSRLQGHPCMHKTPGVDISAGPLGLGLSVGCGMALSQQVTGESFITYVILGDGELQEGSVWEAAMAAAKYRLGKLIAIVDHNGVQLDGTNDEIMPMGNIAAKFQSFGWNVQYCDGHNLTELSDTIDKARVRPSDSSPTVIIANTIKGKGISYMEGKSTWHGAPISNTCYEQALCELGVTTQ